MLSRSFFINMVIKSFLRPAWFSMSFTHLVYQNHYTIVSFSDDDLLKSPTWSFIDTFAVDVSVVISEIHRSFHLTHPYRSRWTFPDWFSPTPEDFVAKGDISVSVAPVVKTVVDTVFLNDGEGGVYFCILDRDGVVIREIEEISTLVSTAVLPLHIGEKNSLPPAALNTKTWLKWEVYFLSRKWTLIDLHIYFLHTFCFMSHNSGHLVAALKTRDDHKK